MYIFLIVFILHVASIMYAFIQSISFHVASISLLQSITPINHFIINYVISC